MRILFYTFYGSLKVSTDNGVIVFITDDFVQQKDFTGINVIYR